MLEYNLFLNKEKTFILPHYPSNNYIQLKNYIILHSKNCINLNICFCKNKIKNNTSIKYLGLIMNSNLKWIDHINSLVTKLRKLSYAFKQLSLY